MVGILDLLTGNDAAASPWGMLYQQQAPVSGFSWRNGFSPFPDPSQLSVAPPPVAANQPSPLDTAQYPAGPIGAPPTFGAGATPFSLAGPAAASPSPASAPAPSAPELSFADRFAPALEQPLRQMAARPATDLSSVNRPGSASAPAPQDQAQPIPVGQNYQMPRFGSADDFEPDDATPANAKPTQGALPGAPPQAAPFSLGGAASGVGDRLGMAARGFMGNLGAGPIGALMAGTGSLLMGRESDPTAIARGNMNATGQALLKKGAPLEDVQAAVTNPTLMTSLISQYYGKDKWKVVQTGENDGEKHFMQQNEIDGTLREIPKAGGSAAGAKNYVQGPDGKLIEIPEGVNRKEFIKQVTHTTADAATGKATEAQAKASSFAARMTQAEALMGGLQNEGQSLYGKAAGEVPVVGNYLQSTNYQKYKQAASAFVTAMLRQESGAAINKDEFTRYEKELFPQPGDDASVVQQKAAMRQAAIQQMTRAAGPGYQRPPVAGTVDVGGKAISWSVK